jgi:sulfite reductase alpha subunit-like flavoprotein
LPCVFLCFFQFADSHVAATKCSASGCSTSLLQLVAMNFTSNSVIVWFSHLCFGSDVCRYCMRVQRTGIEVLRDFPAARPPLELLLDLFPRIRPRPYSIASAHSVTPRRISLCISHVQFTSRTKYCRVGLCSSFLARAEPGYRIALKVSPGSFKAPPSNMPLIMVGPGTGIAPLRAIYLHRSHARARGEAVSSSDALFFGCRDDSDWLYKVRAARVIMIEFFSYGH